MENANQLTVVRPDGSLNVMTINVEPSMTQQQFKDEADINNIVKKYTRTGEFTHLATKVGTYGDFSNIKDWQSMIHQVSSAKEAFQDLPAKIRARFQNDPGQLISFLQDSKNYDEGVKLGLIDRPSTDPDAVKNDSNDNTIASTKTVDPVPKK